MKNLKIIKTIPFILIAIYYFISRMFNLDFAYSMAILSVMNVIGLLVFLKTQKDKDPTERKNKGIMMLVYSVLVLGVFMYSVFFVE